MNSPTEWAKVLLLISLPSIPAILIAIWVALR